MRSTTRRACGSASRPSRRTAFSRACARRGWPARRPWDVRPFRFPGPRARRPAGCVRSSPPRSARSARSASRACPYAGRSRRSRAPTPSAYSAETIARGRVLAQLGGCIVCHTAEMGAELAGGRPFDTPFGRVYATNITPDEATGVGAWSFEAFARAMREGVARDGRHLFPAFPYTSFARRTRPTCRPSMLSSWRRPQSPRRTASPSSGRPSDGVR